MFKNNIVILFIILIGMYTSTSMAGCGRGVGAQIYGALTGDCKGAEAADDIHASIGRPLDSIGAGVVDGVAPGAGSAWLVQDRLRRMQGGNGFPAPGRPLFTSSRFGPRMGNICGTMAGNCIAGLAPIGSGCGCPTYRGLAMGRILQ